ncbi:hypothetical protein R3P38DRAFT_2789313 [Favolaschia claudopus]|uniref:DUF6534 domain-containing protein n=1 Tax=Favolaschia claudopus TaxID=2862362 RepID=A0AAW0AJC1_9AGAR
MGDRELLMGCVESSSEKRKSANKQRDSNVNNGLKTHIEIGDVYLGFAAPQFKPNSSHSFVLLAISWVNSMVYSEPSALRMFLPGADIPRVLDTLQLVFIGHLLYFWVITNYANPTILSFNICRTISGPKGVHIEQEKCLLNRNNCFEIVEHVLINNNLQWITSVALASASVADMLIALSLSYYLRKSRTGIKTTDSLVNKLILYAMSTGLLTGICVLIDMICFLAMPGNLVHVAFNIVSGKLYTNSLLVSLNFREVIRRSTNIVFLTNIDPGGTALEFRTTTEPDLSVDRSLDTSSNAAGAVSSKSFNGMKFSETV